MTPILLNRHQKNGSWSLSGDYFEYRGEGGRLSPQAWNEVQQRLKKEARAKFSSNEALKEEP